MDELGALRLGAAQGEAERADELVLVVVDPLTGERSATAVGAAVAIACEGAQPLAEQVALEIGTGSGHAAHIRRANVRSFRLFTIAQCGLFADHPLVKSPAYVRIRTNCDGAG